MKAGRVIKIATRLLMAFIIPLSLFISSPATVQAGTVPLDLKLNRGVVTSWNINNIQPGDTGNVTVELYNAGTSDGFVTIWISDIVSYEGINPESESGNTTEPGELADYLLLNLSDKGLSTDSDFPTTIGKLPRSATGPGYIEVIPVKAGASYNLCWDWHLPAQAGNDVQGDGLSFTINYLIQECKVTNVSSIVNNEGVFTKEVTIESKAGDSQITIEKDTTGQTSEGEPVKEIWIIKTDKKPQVPPEDKTAIGVNYDAGPEGVTFDRPVIITLTYRLDDIPPGVSEEDLRIAVWDKDAREWGKLEGCTVDTVNKTISAPITHFSRYIITAPVVPVPPVPPIPPSPPPPPSGGGFELSPPVDTGGKDIVKKPLEMDMLGKKGNIEIGPDGTLNEPLTITDPSGNFIIDIDRGARITGSDGVELRRIELVIIEELIVVPDNKVILSPVYRLTGYTPGMEVTRLLFKPPARLTISYQTKDLPENIFLPFIARYTDELGWEKVIPPYNAVVETGKAKAEIDHASLFAVMAELAPPPPPLPAKFKISNLIINPGQAKFGQPITISLTAANEGASTGNYELYLKIDGFLMIVEEISLSSNSSESLSFKISNMGIGKHEVEVAGLTGQFIVVSTASLPFAPRIDWFGLDLIIGTIAVGGLLVLYLVVRRLYRTQQP